MTGTDAVRGEVERIPRLADIESLERVVVAGGEAQLAEQERVGETARERRAAPMGRRRGTDRIVLAKGIVRDRRRRREEWMLPTTRRRRRGFTPLVPDERDRSQLARLRLRLLVRDRHGCGCGRRRTSAVAARLDGVCAGLDVEQRAAAGGERAREDLGHGSEARARARAGSTCVMVSKQGTTWENEREGKESLERRRNGRMAV